ncbi:hypothetical protein UA08_06732, partial [Talaromyces atroroseus]
MDDFSRAAKVISMPMDTHIDIASDRGANHHRVYQNTTPLCDYGISRAWQRRIFNMAYVHDADARASRCQANNIDDARTTTGTGIHTCMAVGVQ